MVDPTAQLNVILADGEMRASLGLARGCQLNYCLVLPRSGISG